MATIEQIEAAAKIVYGDGATSYNIFVPARDLTRWAARHGWAFATNGAIIRRGQHA